mgnify:CR=1 FL=1
MANKEKQAENKEKIGIGAWLALIVLILVLSGAFRTAEGPIKVLDFTNLAGSFGQIGDTGANLIGKGGTGAKDGFMAGFNLIPAVMFFCGLLGVFEQLGAFKASDILFRPLLRPLLGIPGKCGIAFISSFTGSDVAAVMTRELYEDGEIDKLAEQYGVADMLCLVDEDSKDAEDENADTEEAADAETEDAAEDEAE